MDHQEPQKSRKFGEKRHSGDGWHFTCQARVLPLLVAAALLGPLQALPRGTILLAVLLLGGLVLAERGTRSAVRWSAAVFCGAGLGGLALAQPDVYLVVALAGCGWALSARRDRAYSWLLVQIAALGMVFPALILALCAGLNTDAASIIGMSLHPAGSLTELFADCLCAVVVGALLSATLHSHVEQDNMKGIGDRLWLGSALLVLVTAVIYRALWVISVIRLPTDLLVWSESPALLNLLKLKVGEPFYGPRENVNSYSYSPGLELLQYSLLRPVGLELSLRAHRVLGLVWQLASTLVLYRALWPRIGPMLRPIFGRGAGLVVGLTIATAVFSSILAPHIHPDHALMFCFSLGLALLLREPQSVWLTRLLWVLVPVVAVIFKLTAVGLGLGLGVVALWDKSAKRVACLVLAGVLALGTVPVFDATLGHFSDYALQLQSSHPMDWQRWLEVPSSPPGLLLLLSLVAALLAKLQDPVHRNTRDAWRILVVTAIFGAISLVAYLKHGGRSNSLLPFAIGGLVSLWLSGSVLLEQSGILTRGFRTGWALLPVAMVLVVMPRAAPVASALSTYLNLAHARQVSWFREGQKKGKRRLPGGMAAYLDAGLREVPLDSPHTAAELRLGRHPEYQAFCRRITDGYWDGVLVTNNMLLEEQLLPVTTAQLFDVAGPPELQGRWPTESVGYVLLERRR